MKKFLVICLCMLSTPVIAWDGYDYATGSYIEIDKGNLVREGEDIEIYDYGTGEYKDVEVQNVDSFGSIVEVEVYDYDTGEYRTFEMEED